MLSLRHEYYLQNRSPVRRHYPSDCSNKTANNLIKKDISPDLSLATTKATDYYEKETTPYNRYYFVLEGELELTIDGEISMLQKGDTCFISKNTTYEMRGTFEAVTINQPAFGS